MCEPTQYWSGSSPQQQAAVLYPDAVPVVEKIIAVFSLCPDGEQIAWKAARYIQAGIDRAKL